MIDLIVCPYSDEFPRNSEGDVVELAGGRLLLAWTEFYGGYGDHDAAWISTKVSVDGGLTWGDKSTLQENLGRMNVMSASFLRLASQDLLFFYLVKHSPADCQVYVRRSRDEGLTWTEARALSSRPGYHVMNNARPVQLASGRILAPVALTGDIRTGSPSRVFCYLSDDDGHRWRPACRDTGFAGSSAQEPGVVELPDGTILMIIRTELGCVYCARSSDSGETWTTPVPSSLVSPAAPATMIRLPSTGDLLIVWNKNPAGAQARWQDRTPLTAALSPDGGSTWHHVKDLEPSSAHCYAYTSITPVDEDLCLTYYEWERTAGWRPFENTSLKFRRLPISWFYAQPASDS